MSQKSFNENIFLQATKPSRYVGGEINSVKKSWSDEIGADGYAENAYGAVALVKSFVA